jgi:hypothetical protein
VQKKIYLDNNKSNIKHKEYGEKEKKHEKEKKETASIYRSVPVPNSMCRGHSGHSDTKA